LRPPKAVFKVNEGRPNAVDEQRKLLALTTCGSSTQKEDAAGQSYSAHRLCALAAVSRAGIDAGSKSRRRRREDNVLCLRRRRTPIQTRAAGLSERYVRTW
jgi:hypothetical protein